MTTQRYGRLGEAYVQAGAARLGDQLVSPVQGVSTMKAPGLRTVALTGLIPLLARMIASQALATAGLAARRQNQSCWKATPTVAKLWPTRTDDPKL